MKKILIVDDEPDISNVVRLYLESNGFDAITASDGREALEAVELVNPDLIILDVQMPVMDGLEVCREIRKNSHVPIIFLSCKSEGPDKIMGLTMGGDDYIAKPFDPGELLARVNASLRRQDQLTQNKADSEENTSDSLNFSGLNLETNTHKAMVDDTEVELSAKEFQLIWLLAKKPGVVWGSEDIYRQLWQSESMGDNRTVMVHVSNLRKKIENDPANPKFIITVKGVGYKFVDPG